MKKGKRGKYGQNMIKLAIRFWTNNLPDGTDEKTAWKSGVIYLYKNELKGIKPSMARFNDIKGDFMENLFELLKKQNIKLIEVPKEQFKVINK